jgi:chitinase
LFASYDELLILKKNLDILYAFADVSADSGTISLTDSNADTDVSVLSEPLKSQSLTLFQKHFTGDSWNDSGTNLYGCLKQM